MRVELSRFQVRKGKSGLVDEWMEFLNKYLPEVLLTLQDEKMYVETIFRESTAEGEFLYWYSVQGDGGKRVDQSMHWVDQKHLEYWQECIEPDYSTDMKVEVVMIPKLIRQVMG